MMLAELAKARVAILGAGREGQAAWRYLRKAYPAMQVTLVAEAAPEPAFVEQLSEHDHLLIGPLAQAGLGKFDFLIRSPGISPYRKSIRQAVAAGARLTSPSNLWFAVHPEHNTICVTGTKGKSTTSALLAHMLEACGLRVQLAGNIGLPLLACDTRGVDWWVIELSSYQLADLEAEPGISVILNLSSEHLDWHGSEQAYYKDKLRLVELAGNRPLIANASDPFLKSVVAGRDNTMWFNGKAGFRVNDGVLFDGHGPLRIKLPEGLPGAHNLANIAAALTVIRAIGASVAESIESIDSFKSLPHRLQVIGEQAGVKFVNDSISSTPFATVAALEAFSGQKVTLLVGGLDRGVDWTPYFDQIRARLPSAVIGMPDSGARIIGELRRAEISPQNGLHESEGLEQAVSLAKRITGPGGIVLLSPGAPSFPRFRDYIDRGRKFAEQCGFDVKDSGAFNTGKK